MQYQGSYLFSACERAYREAKFKTGLRCQFSAIVAGARERIHFQKSYDHENLGKCSLGGLVWHHKIWVSFDKNFRIFFFNLKKIFFKNFRKSDLPRKFCLRLQNTPKWYILPPPAPLGIHLVLELQNAKMCKIVLSSMIVLGNLVKWSLEGYFFLFLRSNWKSSQKWGKMAIWVKFVPEIGPKQPTFRSAKNTQKIIKTTLFCFFWKVESQEKLFHTLMITKRPKFTLLWVFEEKMVFDFFFTGVVTFW